MPGHQECHGRGVSFRSPLLPTVRVCGRLQASTHRAWESTWTGLVPLWLGLCLVTVAAVPAGAGRGGGQGGQAQGREDLGQGPGPPYIRDTSSQPPPQPAWSFGRISRAVSEGGSCPRARPCPLHPLWPPLHAPAQAAAAVPASCPSSEPSPGHPCCSSSYPRGPSVITVTSLCRCCCPPGIAPPVFSFTGGHVGRSTALGGQLCPGRSPCPRGLVRRCPVSTW